VHKGARFSSVKVAWILEPEWPQKGTEGTKIDPFNGFFFVTFVLVCVQSERKELVKRDGE
jgi:hypothetical protein